MNKYAIYHIPDSRYCFPVDAHTLVLRLRMAKEDQGCHVFLVCAPKYEFALKRTRQELSVAFTDSLFIYYEIHLMLADVRFAYVFQIEEKGRRFYYSEDGVTETYNYKESFYHFFQMPYINANDVMPTVPWMRGAVFYQIFVERFRMGDSKKDTSYINMKWGDLPTPKSFAGGDLCGIIEKLDYIHGLGVTAIYLTPIFQSISNHKYDISDYYTVDRQFGDMDTLRELVNGAHQRGMRVVLDAVFNHCSSRLKQFADVEKKGRASEYYNWFLIDGDFPVSEPCNYECFAACEYMPKLNTANPEVQDFLIDIGRYWIREADIDGWRLDVADEVSHEFWRQFRRAIKAEKEDAVLIGENWHDAYAFLRGDQYDSIMNYSFTKACLDYFAKGVLDAKGMAERLAGNYMRNTEPVNYMMLNLLDSHDTFRFYTEVGGSRERLLAALALEMVYPGAACIYYGTEIPMEGGYDPDSRRCFPWDDMAGASTDNHFAMSGDCEEAVGARTCIGTEKRFVTDGDFMEVAPAAAKDKNFGEQFRALTALRTRPVIQYGELRLSAENGLLCVRRIWEAEELRLYINRTDDPVKVKPLLSKMEKETIVENTPVQKPGLVTAERKVKMLAENQYCVEDGMLNSEGYLICMI